MYGPVSSTFLQSLQQTRTMVAQADLYYDGQLVLANLNISSWRLTVDRNSDSHRSGSIVLAEPTLIPTLSNTLSPYGVELWLRVGFAYPNGTSELVPVGVFPIETTQWKDAIAGAIPSVQIFDRQKSVDRDAALTSSSRGGWLAQTLLHDLIYDALKGGIQPTIQFSFDPSLPNPRLPGGVMWDGSRWGLVKTCAQAMGADVYFDPMGNVRVLPVPVMTSTTKGSDAVWSVAAGVNLVDASRSVTRTGVFNAVAVYGSVPNGSTAQPVGFAYDLDTTSATYYNGPFGASSTKINNPLLTTDFQCYQAAGAILASVTGRARNLSFSCLGNPAMETGDLILVKFADGSMELHLIDSFTMSNAGDCSAATRTVQYQPFVGS